MRPAHQTVTWKTRTCFRIKFKPIISVDCTRKDNLTCCFRLIFSFGDLLVRLDRNDKGKTNAALPSRTSANNSELTPTDVPGLRRRTEKITKRLDHIGYFVGNNICLQSNTMYLSLTTRHFSMSKASIPT